MKPSLKHRTALLAVIAAGALALLPDTTRANSTIGAWSAVQPSWPAFATHTLLLPDGRVMFWRSTSQHIWNPTNQFFTTLPSAGYNIFCSGHILMRDGRVFVGGGHIPGNTGLNDASIYDPAGNSWTKLADMNAGRWYPSQTMLPNGDILVTGGLREDGSQNNEAQVWQIASSTWRNLSNATKSLPLYPEQFLVSSNRIFFAKSPSQYLDTSGAGSWSTNIANRRQTGRESAGSAVMYQWQKILFAGGLDPATNNCETIDLNVGAPAWSWTGNMANKRRHHNLTVLPDGKVLATGGAGVGDDGATAVHAAEMWDPATGNWTLMASNTIYRGYHSTALLLPDGRVLSAGGNPNPSRSSEIYSPPYLFNGARPTISSAPATFTLGSTIFIGTPDGASITKVALIRLGAVTHSFNMNQRYDTLTFTQAGGGLNVTIHGGGSRVPPGHYMIFILNGNGVPSVAKIMRRT